MENALARRLLSGEFLEGDRVLVDYADGEYSFSKAKQRAKAAAS